MLDRLTHPVIRHGEFSDTLSPVFASVGLDVTDQLKFARPNNLLVEGISDHFYILTWARLFRPGFADIINVFPGSGAATLPILASLFTGWGLKFGVLLDRDDEGNKIRAKFEKDFALSPDRLVQPQDASAIEDLLSHEDFRQLLAWCDNALAIEPGERPSNAIKRQGIDKVLLARTFAEKASIPSTQFTKKTREAVERLLSQIEVACGVVEA